MPTQNPSCCSSPARHYRPCRRFSFTLRAKSARREGTCLPLRPHRPLHWRQSRRRRRLLHRHRHQHQHHKQHLENVSVWSQMIQRTRQRPSQRSAGLSPPRHQRPPPRSRRSPLLLPLRRKRLGSHRRALGDKPRSAHPLSPGHPPLDLHEAHSSTPQTERETRRATRTRAASSSCPLLQWSRSSLQPAAAATTAVERMVEAVVVAHQEAGTVAVQ